MKQANEVLEGMNIEIGKPDISAMRVVAESLNIVMSDEELDLYSVDLRTMRDTKAHCESCAGLESCPLDHTGYEYTFSRGFREIPVFSLRKCERRAQYEELIRNEELLESCRIPASLRQKSYRTFDATENPAAVMVAGELIRDKTRKGAIFFGPTGVGKTHIASAILNNRIITGGVGIYATVPELMDSLRLAMQNHLIDEARAALVSAELLFLDDLGAENPSEFVVEELFKIVNGRNLHGKQIIGTSNLSPEGLRERYAGVGGSRIISRLYESCEWIEMKGRDRRV